MIGFLVAPRCLAIVRCRGLLSILLDSGGPLPLVSIQIGHLVVRVHGLGRLAVLQNLWSHSSLTVSALALVEGRILQVLLQVLVTHLLCDSLRHG